MKHLIEEAFRVAILTEKNSYDLYHNATVMVPDGSGKQVLELLVLEESRLIDEILTYCPDTIPNMMKQPSELPWFNGYFAEPPERRLFNHLRIALLDKHACIERYATFVKTFREPAVCKVFELALSMSRRLLRIIVEEYSQPDLRMHKPGVYRRTKRTRIRVGNLPAPNRHSQLIIS